MMRQLSQSQMFVARLLREEGHDPIDYDIPGLTTSLSTLCQDDLADLHEVDQEWLDHTIKQFARI